MAESPPDRPGPLIAADQTDRLIEGLGSLALELAKVIEALDRPADKAPLASPRP